MDERCFDWVGERNQTKRKGSFGLGFSPCIHNMHVMHWERERIPFLSCLSVLLKLWSVVCGPCSLCRLDGALHAGLTRQGYDSLTHYIC